MRTRQITIEVINSHHLKGRKEGEYIGRGSPLGNPYSHQEGTTALYKVASREEAIEKYRIWLEDQIVKENQEIINELERLTDLALYEGKLLLRCFCAPAPCHGDVIKDTIEGLIERFLKREQL